MFTIVNIRDRILLQGPCIRQDLSATSSANTITRQKSPESVVIYFQMFHLILCIHNREWQQMPWWRKGYAADCRSAYPGSIPGHGSYLSFDFLQFPKSLLRKTRTEPRIIKKLFQPKKLTIVKSKIDVVIPL